MDIYRIYRINQAKNTQNQLDLLKDLEKLENLKIDGNNILFLRNILLPKIDSSRPETAIFKRKDDQHWVLSFFIDYPRLRQNILVHHYSLDTNQENNDDWKKYNGSQKKDYKLYNDLCRLAFLKITQATPTIQEVEQASCAVRDSKSIKNNDLTEASTHYSHIDGRGMMFLSKMESNAHCERNVILLALAHAYLGAIEKITDDLEECIQLNTKYEKNQTTESNEQELRKIYLETAKFNAQYMFSMPVKGQNVGLVAAWRRINSALEIEKLNNELNKKINIVHHILKVDADNKQAERDSRLNMKLWYIGFVISLAGLISVYKNIKELWPSFIP